MTDEKNKTEKSTLYLVATPIGNLSDLSERAVKVLTECDFIAAEDTRNTGKLLSCFGIRKELVSYHEHNKRERGEEILARIAGGETCALVTDAGMPAVSDPGEDLVRLCAEAGVRVTVVPGACACVSALALSALPTRRFSFEGFLPVPNKERKERLSEIEGEVRTLILYEAPHRLRETLADLCRVLGGDRRIALVREMTKKNEEVIRTTLSDAVALYETREPRGEYVLVIEGAKEAPRAKAPDTASLLALTPKEHLAHYEKAGLPRMDAMKAAARDRGMTKSEFYKLVQ